MHIIFEINSAKKPKIIFPLANRREIGYSLDVRRMFHAPLTMSRDACIAGIQRECGGKHYEQG